MNTILFDLDGTLLPMDVEEFTKKYFGLIMQTMNENNRDGKMILDAILKGTMAMVRNDGSHTNEEVFWETFVEATQIPQDEIEPEFYDFYENVFDKINSGIQSQNMIKAAKLLKEKGYRLYLTTNPLFPRVAILKEFDGPDLIRTISNGSPPMKILHLVNPLLTIIKKLSKASIWMSTNA